MTSISLFKPANDVRPRLFAEEPLSTSNTVTVQTEESVSSVESVSRQIFASPSLVESYSQRTEKNPSCIPYLDDVPVRPSCIPYLDDMPIKHSDAISSSSEGKPPLLDKEVNSLSLEKFNENIKSFIPPYTNPEQAAAELLQDIPQHLELAGLVDFIFNECHHWNMPDLLRAFLIVYPSFNLSPYDKIRHAIVEDDGRVLNNSSLMALFKEHALDADEEKLTACYDLAYRLNHPYIFRLPQTPILSSDYTLNFLWVNLNPQDRVKNTAQNIFGNGFDPSENAECIKDPIALRALEKNEESLETGSLESWEKIKKSFAYRISRWADVNPGAQINLWYDSALVTQKAQQNTFEMLRGISKSRGIDLNLRDVRQLSNIRGEIENSLHPGTPVYYRVDLIKALIADHMTSSSEERGRYCIVSDIDVEAMSPEQLFDQRTVDYLNLNGYVFNRVGCENFENNFFIFDKTKEDIQKIHNKILLQQTAKTISCLRKFPINTSFNSQFTLCSQFVYGLYTPFLKEIGENKDTAPRKVVKCPKSQFSSKGFSDNAHQAETFRFIGSSNTPYTKHGRNINRVRGEGHIVELINWKAEPLPAIE